MCFWAEKFWGWVTVLFALRADEQVGTFFIHAHVGAWIDFEIDRDSTRWRVPGDPGECAQNGGSKLARVERALNTNCAGPRVEKDEPNMRAIRAVHDVPGAAGDLHAIARAASVLHLNERAGQGVASGFLRCAAKAVRVRNA